jgi:hypothetical protein
MKESLESAGADIPVSVRIHVTRRHGCSKEVQAPRLLKGTNGANDPNV